LKTHLSAKQTKVTDAQTSRQTADSIAAGTQNLDENERPQAACFAAFAAHPRRANRPAARPLLTSGGCQRKCAIAQSPGGEPREMNLKAKVTPGKRVPDLNSDMEIDAILRERGDDAKLGRHRYYEDLGGVFVWKMPAFDLPEPRSALARRRPAGARLRFS
jgi:hypothetical protein